MSRITSRNEILSFQLRKKDFGNEAVRDFRTVCAHKGCAPTHQLRILVGNFLKENSHLILADEPSKPLVS